MKPSKPPNPDLPRLIVQAFGGLTATSRALGHRQPTTVFAWVKTGRIPKWRVEEIRKAAEREGVKLPRGFRD